MNNKPTFADLAAVEPELDRLLAEAKRWHTVNDPDFCANAVWYGYGAPHRGLKARLVRLVGFQAGRSDLRTSAAYDVAYETIYEALPDCRGDCSCTSYFQALVGAER